MGACYSTHTRRVSCCRYATRTVFRWVHVILLTQDVFLVHRYAVTQGPCLDGCLLFYLHKTCFLL